MTHRRPFRRHGLWRLVLALAWLVAGPAHAEQHAPPAPEAERQVFEKIVEARGHARVKRYAEALKQLDAAASLAEGMEDKLPLALALHNAAEVQLLKGEPLDALKGYHRALGVYTDLGHETGVGLVQRRIRTLSRLLSKPRKPTAQAATAPAKPQEPLSLIDQAVERVRRRKEARGRGGPEAAPPGPVQVTRSEPGAADDPVEQAYVESLRKKLNGNSRYPDYARRKGHEGAVDLVFAVGENGDVDNVKLLKSSGFILLDVEALRNVRESAPFGPVPAATATVPLTVRLTFSYELPAAPDGAP